MFARDDKNETASVKILAQGSNIFNGGGLKQKTPCR
jgi:hypothetical protein